MTSEWSIILPILSVLAAFFSALYAKKSHDAYERSYMPIIIPEIIDVSIPNKIKIKLTNKGNGIATNIRTIAFTNTMKYATDLLPEKYNSPIIEFEHGDLIDKEGKNKLLYHPYLEIICEDMFGREVTTIAKFKADVTKERADIGHIDKNFIGFRFYGYTKSLLRKKAKFD